MYTENVDRVRQNRVVSLNKITRKCILALYFRKRMASFCRSTIFLNVLWGKLTAQQLPTTFFPLLNVVRLFTFWFVNGENLILI